jgi:pimeloyl-ACP methyl ester carboxylesterase
MTSWHRLTTLRRLASDAAYVASVLKTMKGPIVLVGHSYGGAVITAAAHRWRTSRRSSTPRPSRRRRTRAPPTSRGGSRTMNSPPRSFPGPAGRRVRGHRSLHRPGEVPLRVRRRCSCSPGRPMAAAQRPVTQAAFGEPLAVEPAGRTIPSSYLVGSRDRAIDPAAERFTARRAGACGRLDGRQHVGRPHASGQAAAAWTSSTRSRSPR